ncbi:MAG TPA: SDR family oxidoreductase [Anaerolineaceae bacterium]|jgi:dTDP-4-dehydrorhamnose reductase|nr:SDR family oxidoreductase [Anaerolineaceae bacterium]
MTKLLVTGASGHLGLNLALLAVEHGYKVTGWTHSRGLMNPPFACESVDIGDLDALPAALRALEPEVIIHCAAIANVDVAEKQPELSQRINADAPRVIASVAKQLGAKMIQISTDAVFDGSKGNYKEDDAVNPLNAYAKTKLAGERAVMQTNPDAAIARVVFYGWTLEGNRSLAEFFYNNLVAGKSVNGFTDAYFNPLYVRDLAETLLEIAEANLKGIWHTFGNDTLSKYDFGVALAREFGLDESLIKPVSASQGRDVVRSLNLSTNSDKLARALGHPLPGLTQGLTRLKEDFDAGWRERLAKFKA